MSYKAGMPHGPQGKNLSDLLSGMTVLQQQFYIRHTLGANDPEGVADALLNLDSAPPATDLPPIGNEEVSNVLNKYMRYGHDRTYLRGLLRGQGIADAAGTESFLEQHFQGQYGTRPESVGEFGDRHSYNQQRYMAEHQRVRARTEQPLKARQETPGPDDWPEGMFIRPGGSTFMETAAISQASHWVQRHAGPGTPQTTQLPWTDPLTVAKRTSLLGTRPQVDTMRFSPSGLVPAESFSTLPSGPRSETHDRGVSMRTAVPLLNIMPSGLNIVKPHAIAEIRSENYGEINLKGHTPEDLAQVGQTWKAGQDIRLFKGHSGIRNPDSVKWDRAVLTDMVQVGGNLQHTIRYSQSPELAEMSMKSYYEKSGVVVGNVAGITGRQDIDVISQMKEDPAGLAYGVLMNKDPAALHAQMNQMFPGYGKLPQTWQGGSGAFMTAFRRLLPTISEDITYSRTVHESALGGFQKAKDTGADVTWSPTKGRKGWYDTQATIPSVVGDMLHGMERGYPAKMPRVTARDLNRMKDINPQLHRRIEAEGAGIKAGYQGVLGAALSSTGLFEAPANARGLDRQGWLKLGQTAERAALAANPDITSADQLPPGAMDKALMSAAQAEFGDTPIQIKGKEGSRYLASPQHAQQLMAQDVLEDEEATAFGRSYMSGLSVLSSPGLAPEIRKVGVDDAIRQQEKLAFGRNFQDRSMSTYMPRSGFGGSIVVDPALAPNQMTTNVQDVLKAYNLKPGSERAENFERLWREGKLQPHAMSGTWPNKPGQAYDPMGAAHMLHPGRAQEQGVSVDPKTRMVMSEAWAGGRGRDSDKDAGFNRMLGDVIGEGDDMYIGNVTQGLASNQQVLDWQTRAESEGAGSLSDEYGKGYGSVRALAEASRTERWKSYTDEELTETMKAKARQMELIGSSYNQLEQMELVSAATGNRAGASASEALFGKMYGTLQRPAALAKPLEELRGLMSSFNPATGGYKAHFGPQRTARSLRVGEDGKWVSGSSMEAFMDASTGRLMAAVESGEISPSTAAGVMSGRGQAGGVQALFEKLSAAKGTKRPLIREEIRSSVSLDKFLGESPLGIVGGAQALRKAQRESYSPRGGSSTRKRAAQTFLSSFEREHPEAFKTLSDQNWFQAQWKAANEKGPVVPAMERTRGISRAQAAADVMPDEYSGLPRPKSGAEGAGGWEFVKEGRHTDPARTATGAGGRGAQGPPVTGDPNVAPWEEDPGDENIPREAGIGRTSTGGQPTGEDASRGGFSLTDWGEEFQRRQTAAMGAFMGVSRDEFTTQSTLFRDNITAWHKMAQKELKAGGPLSKGFRDYTTAVAGFEKQVSRGMRQHHPGSLEMAEFQGSPGVPAAMRQLANVNAVVEQAKLDAKIADPLATPQGRATARVRSMLQSRAAGGGGISFRELVNAQRVGALSGTEAGSYSSFVTDIKSPASRMGAAGAFLGGEPDKQATQGWIASQYAAYGQGAAGGGFVDGQTAELTKKYGESVKNITGRLDEWEKTIQPAIESGKELTVRQARAAKILQRGDAQLAAAADYYGSANRPDAMYNAEAQRARGAKMVGAYDDARESQDWDAATSTEGRMGAVSRGFQAAKKLMIGWTPMQMSRAWGMTGGAVFNQYIPAATQAAQLNWQAVAQQGGEGGLPSGVAGGVMRFEADKRESMIQAGQQGYRTWGAGIPAMNMIREGQAMFGPAIGAGMVTGIGMSAMGSAIPTLAAAAGPAALGVGAIGAGIAMSQNMYSYGGDTPDNQIAAAGGSGNVIGALAQRSAESWFRDKGFTDAGAAFGGKFLQFPALLARELDPKVMEQFHAMGAKGMRVKGQAYGELGMQQQLGALTYAGEQLTERTGSIFEGMDSGQISQSLGQMMLYDPAMQDMSADTMIRTGGGRTERMVELGFGPEAYGDLARQMGMGSGGSLGIWDLMARPDTTPMDRRGLERALGQYSQLRQYGETPYEMGAKALQFGALEGPNEAAYNQLVAGDPMAWTQMANQGFAPGFMRQMDSSGMQLGTRDFTDNRAMMASLAQRPGTDTRIGGVRGGAIYPGALMSPGGGTLELSQGTVDVGVGGMWGTQDWSTAENRMYQDYQYGFQRQGLQMSAQHHAASRGISTRMREASYAGQMAQFGIQGAQIDMNDRQTREQMLFQKGISDTQFAWQEDDMTQGFERAMVGLTQQMSDLNKNFGRQMTRFAWSEADIRKGAGRTEEGFDWAEQDLNRNFQRQMTQFGWQGEDLQRQRQQSNMQFGWQMEDFDENIRFASGRQRKSMMRQRERTTIMHGMQESTFDTEEGRLETRTAWAEEDFAREMERLSTRREQAEEDAETELERLRVRKEWAIADFEEAGGRLEERRSWLEADYERDQERHSQRVEWAQERYDMNLEHHAERIAMSKAQLGAAMAAAKIQKELQDEMDELNEEYWQAQHKRQVEALDNAEAHDLKMREIQDIQQDIARGLELQQGILREVFSMFDPNGTLIRSIEAFLKEVQRQMEAGADDAVLMQGRTGVR